jgi:hypothetical protein
MSELSYVHAIPLSNIRVLTDIVNGTTSTSTEHTFVSEEILEVEKPVRVIDDSIEINERLLEENQIYQILYKGERYYVRISNGVTDIFQLEE